MYSVAFIVSMFEIIDSVLQSLKKKIDSDKSAKRKNIDQFYYLKTRKSLETIVFNMESFFVQALPEYLVYEGYKSDFETFKTFGDANFDSYRKVSLERIRDLKKNYSKYYKFKKVDTNLIKQEEEEQRIQEEQERQQRQQEEQERQEGRQGQEEQEGQNEMNEPFEPFERQGGKRTKQKRTKQKRTKRKKRKTNKI
jgi:hypothetical protein